jgi:hypothetical protein
MRPAAHHVGRALPHELGARVGQSRLRAHLRLGRTNEKEEGRDRRDAGTKEHDGLAL